MRSWRIAVVALALLSAGTGQAQDTSRAIIEQAIKAHGGEERLSRNRADRVKFKGILFLTTPRDTAPRETARFVAETTVQLPAQFKSVMEMTSGGDKHTVVHIVNGEKVSVLVDGKPEKVEPAVLAEMRDTMMLDRAVRLVPLLRDRTYGLAPADDIKVNDRPAAGVRVTAQGRKELRLYFDKELGLLVKAEHLLDDGSGKQVRQEQYFGDFKDVGGYKRPFKVIAFRDGRKVMEAEVVDVKQYDQIDDREFTRP
jgi:hypothetical protein